MDHEIETLKRQLENLQKVKLMREIAILEKELGIVKPVDPFADREWDSDLGYVPRGGTAVEKQWDNINI